MRKIVVILTLVAVVGLGAWWYTRPRDYPLTNANAGATLDGPVIAFGDSLTEGRGAGPGESYVDLISKRVGIEILNKGVSGNTSGDALNRLDRDVLALKPRLVIVCLGGNDLLRRVNGEETFKNLDEIVSRIQAQGAMVILIGLDFSLGSDFGSRIDELARRRGCPLVRDILGGIRGDASLMADTVHPNAKGYVKFADKVEPVLRKYLGK